MIDAYRSILDGTSSLSLPLTPRIYHCEPTWSFRPDPLPDFDLWCVLAGHGRLSVCGETHVIRPGSCFVLPPKSRPIGTQDPERRLSVFFCHFSTGEENVPHPAVFYWLVHDIAFLTTLADRCERAGLQETPVAQAQASLLVRQILMLLLVEAVQTRDKPSDPEIESLMAEIRREPAQQWTVADMAHQSCLSRSQLTRRFQRAAGEAPLAYGIRVRLERAAQLLSETSMSTQEIAAALGYESPQYFCRQFRAWSGEPPARYRRLR